MLGGYKLTQVDEHCNANLLPAVVILRIVNFRDLKPPCLSKDKTEAAWLIPPTLSDTSSVEILPLRHHSLWNLHSFVWVSQGYNIWVILIPLFQSFSESITALSVQCPTKRYVVILFQPVTLVCNYQTSSTSQSTTVLWKYKSYCRDPVTAALNPSSADNILAQNNPNYDPNIECADSQRTVRSVASKSNGAVTLAPEYQGRKISIINSEWQTLHLCQCYKSMYKCTK